MSRSLSIARWPIHVFSIFRWIPAIGRWRATDAIEPWADQSRPVLHAAFLPQPVERAAVARRRPVLHGTLLRARAQRAVFGRHAGVSRTVPVVVAGGGERCHDHALKGATHFLAGQDTLIDELADLLVAWADRL